MEAPLESLVSARNALAAEVVRSIGELRLRVTGSSMLPAIRPRDELLIRRCSIAAAGVGDVILFLRRGHLFAHRVIARSGNALVVQGDAVEAPDADVSASEFLGKAVIAWRGDRSFAIRSRMTVRESIVARLARRSMLAGRLLTRLCSPKVRGAP